MTNSLDVGVENVTNYLLVCWHLAKMWNTANTLCLLQGLQNRRSLWDSKSKEYSNNERKRREYDELLKTIKEVTPEMTLQQMKLKIQSIRTQYREELRKIQKSKSTGTGSDTVYKPKWQYFEECAFLRDVIVVSLAQSNRSNVAFELENEDENIDEETKDDQEDVGNTQNPASATQSSAATTTATCKRKTAPIGSPARGQGSKSKRNWMEKAAWAIELISKQDECDEWETFGRDVANDMRSLPAEKRRKAKFAIQKVIVSARHQ